MGLLNWSLCFVPNFGIQDICLTPITDASRAPDREGVYPFDRSAVVGGRWVCMIRVLGLHLACGRLRDRQKVRENVIGQFMTWLTSDLLQNVTSIHTACQPEDGAWC